MPVKPFQDYAAQIRLLESRGLDIPDHAFAEEVLMHHNYYRFSAYRFPFQDSTDHFRVGTCFNDLWNLYQFDGGLRLLVGEACKFLEIAVRARWAYVLGELHGGMAYEDPLLFQNVQRHTQHLASLDREIARSHEVFIQHHKTAYGMPRPPIWAACEVMSFGLLSRFYANLKHASTKKKIARTYDMGGPLLESFLTHASYLRNLCAHHSRFWNRSFTITFSLPTSQPATILPALNRDPAASRLVYNSIVVLAHIMSIVSPASDWKHRLRVHLGTLNRPNHSEMGFPTGWESMTFWQQP